MPKKPRKGILGSLFASPVAAILTILIVIILAWLLWYVWEWGFHDAVYQNDYKACMANRGHACWGFVAEKWRLILFGRFPYALQWRPALATLIVLIMLVITAFPQTWTKTGAKFLGIGWLLSLGAFFLLMSGGVFGMEKIDSDSWGGFPLTVILTLLGMTLSTPLGILLAIGRRSKMGVVRTLSIGYIELIRGVPLITVLFVASYIFPLLLPPSWRIEAFWRIVAGIVLFQAAYMAETIRGGLQTIPKGQFEATDSLGMTKAQGYLFVILPQAFVSIIPAFVNSLLSTFMDTSLVTIVSMYDLTGSLRLALGDPNWRYFFLEGYLFIAIIYFVFSFIMSRYSIWLEKRIENQKKGNLIPNANANANAT